MTTLTCNVRVGVGFVAGLSVLNNESGFKNNVTLKLYILSIQNTNLHPNGVIFGKSHIFSNEGGQNKNYSRIRRDKNVPVKRCIGRRL